MSAVHAGGDRHQREGDGVARPVPQRLVDQQPAHQREGRIAGPRRGSRPWTAFMRDPFATLRRSSPARHRAAARSLPGTARIFKRIQRLPGDQRRGSRQPRVCSRGRCGCARAPLAHAAASISSRSQASAWATMVERSSKRGCQPSVARTRSRVGHDLRRIAGAPRRRSRP